VQNADNSGDHSGIYIIGYQIVTANCRVCSPAMVPVVPRPPTRRNREGVLSLQLLLLLGQDARFILDAHTLIAQTVQLLHELGFEKGFGLGGHNKGGKFGILGFTTINRPLLRFLHAH